MKRIAILGSTGSIGQSALEVVRRFPKDFYVAALSTNANIRLLYQQIKAFHPKLVCVKDAKRAEDLKAGLRLEKIKLYVGEDGLNEMVQDKLIDDVLLAIGGSSALLPLLKAIDSGKDITLANKEALVIAGRIVMDKAAERKVKVKPVDSEQSAIWQCLNGQDKDRLKYIYLTASGGPFWNKSRASLSGVSIRQVLRHPRWKMGRKITVDSATLMNKGLEVLETMYLFNIKPERIKILIHPESIIHSMVEFVDGVVLAQLSVPDMRIPIQYALSFPRRCASTLAGIDFCKLGSISFQKPDCRRFPCLELAYKAAQEEGTMPAVLNAANEVSVDEFFKKRIDFISIPRIIEKVMMRHHSMAEPDLGEILKADRWAREEAHGIIDGLG